MGQGDRDRLLGEWTLVAWSGIDADGNHVKHGGESPTGELIYLSSGRVSVQIQHSGRDGFGSRDWTAGDEAERATAYSTYNAYNGTFSLPEPGVAIHHVEMAIHPDQPGMDKRREYVLEGDELILRTQEVETANGPASSELKWERRS